MARFTISDDPLTTLRTWVIYLRNLTFKDNFNGYEWEGNIPPGNVRKISHPLKLIPTRFIIMSGDPTIIRQGTDDKPTNQFFYMENKSGSEDFNGKILILP